MIVFAIKNHRGNVEVSTMQSHQPGEVALNALETEKQITPGDVTKMPEPGEVVAVNGCMHNCIILA